MLVSFLSNESYLRSLISFFTAFVICLLIGPTLIKFLKSLQMGSVRDDVPKSHKYKEGTPSLGGIMIVISMLMSTFIWSDVKEQYVWIALLMFLGYACIGFTDDFLKLYRKRGLKAKSKFFLQSCLALIFILYLHYSDTSSKDILMPFWQFPYSFSPIFIPLAFFVVVGTSNAVNLTDGLDGLVSMPVVFIALAFALIALIMSNPKLALQFSMAYKPQAEELVVVCTSLAGSCLGFLWFNSHPAQVFMGDVGSLSIGALLGIISILLGLELVLFLMGGIFVVETVSVILQVISYKLRKKRIFKMAPLHHHFELIGWSESKIISRFWIISLVLVILGIASSIIR